ncbi:MAG: replication restart helicase PriA [bacterium]
MTSNEIYVEVILPVPVNHGFIYKIDKNTFGEDIEIGKRVLVPFASRMLVGVIVKKDVGRPDYQTKSVERVIDKIPCMTGALIELLKWSSDYYFHPIGDVFKQFMPHRDVRLEVRKFYSLAEQHIDLQGFSDEERDIIRYLTNKKVISETTLTKRFRKSLISRLYKNGIIKIVFKQYDNEQNLNQLQESTGINEQSSISTDSFTLTQEQECIVDALKSDLKTNTFLPILIMGVTGSGKTEIYIRLIEQAIAEGKNAIVLVPEIALTPQLVNRFVKRFGKIVGVIHSKIKPRILKETYKQILGGGIKIVIGVRAAIFAPIKKVGVIVVDEEHEHTYKQEDRFRYNARDVAIMRGKLEHSIVILGSATPSLESYYNAVKGKYKLYTLEHRIHDLPMPDIHVIDLRKERPYKIGNEILTKPVVDALTETFSKNKQAIIMLNKRGYASSVVCEDCGHIEKCPECDISLTYHNKPLQRLVCHYCGYTEPILSKCPVCGSPAIKTIGIGTQRLEEEIKRIFNNINMIRMDRDTTSRIGSHEHLINTFGTGDVMLLVGTQMVAKGLDFPDVELVCLPLLDIGLNIPDFRSAERIFDIIMQSAGRAGRGSAGARVYIQTYNPEYYPIKYAVEYNTELFYKNELTYRKNLFYPPFSRMGLIIFKHKNISVLHSAMNAVDKLIGTINNNGLIISGPVPAPMSKVKGFYVYHLLIRSSRVKLLLDTINMLIEKFRTMIPDIPFTVDMDPVHFV